MAEKIVVANWKMKLTLKQTSDLANKMKTKFKGITGVEAVLCPNFLSLVEAKNILSGSNLKLGAQDVFWMDEGAFTGEVSPTMLVEAGCEYVIIGHSERRKYLLVNYEMIRNELKAVLSVPGLTPIVCIGENWDERKTDRRDFVLFDQLEQGLAGIDVSANQQVIIAYEPIWAIGSGTAIEPSEAEYAHKIIKLTLNDMFGSQAVKKSFRVIYGGSITSKNVNDFVGLDNLDGLLVGGASLDADEFAKLAKALKVK